MRRCHLLLVFIFPFSLSADITIEWSSTPGGNDLQSDGATPINDDFEFLLGTFEGIDPGSGNLSEWEDAFQVFGNVTYSSPSGRFFGNKTLSSNAPPFTTTARAYVWGRNGTGPGSEWILFGRSSWTWPSAISVGPPPLPVRWLVSAVSPEDVILGTVNDGGVQMQSEAVNLSLSYLDWAAAVFEAGEGRAPGSDFEGDGRSNFLEYALGSDPKVHDPPFEVVLNSRLELELMRARDREVSWVLEESADLEVFEEVMEGFEVIEDEPDRLVFRITEKSSARRFFRVEARPGN